jgi:PAS domain S-box-containing protein
MKSKKPEQKKPSVLRKRAEKKLKTKTTAPNTMSDKETQQLIHELQVHQIELEMQNEELRKAQAEIEESRTRYSDLYDFAPVGYFTFDKYGLILEVNLTAAKELGLKRSLLINKPFRTYIVTEDRKLFDQYIQKVFKSGDRQTCEIRLKKKDGKEFYAQLESIALEESSGNNICRTSFIDITGRKRAEKELIKERNTAQEYLDIAGVILVGINADEEVTLINKKGCEILGYEKHEVIGRNWFDTFVPPEIRENVRDAFKKLISAEIEPVRFFENAILTSNGTERIIAWENAIVRDEAGNIVSTLSSGEDITARKAAEDILINALEESQHRQSEISALLKGSHAVLKYHDFRSAAQSIFSSCKKLIGATSGYVALLSKDETENEVVFLDPGGLSCRVDPRLPMPIRGLRGEVCNNKEAIYNNDFLNSEWMKFMPEGHSKLRNVLFAPMIVEGKVVGLLGLGNKPKGFNENDSRMATAFAELAAIALTQKKAEQLLRESREDLNRAQAVAQTGSWRLNVQQNELLWSDENWRIFGVARGIPLTYETFLSTVHPDDREYVDRKWMAALQGEHYDIEHRIVVGDSVRWVRELAELEFDKDGILLGGFGITQDITEKKYAEEELREAKEALQTANEELESKVQDRTAELIDSREQLRNLLEHLQSVREAERTHIAREIHDEFGTILTALKIDLSWLEKRFTVEQEPLKEKTGKSLDLINSAIKTVQKISSQLRPGILDHLGLASAIEWEVKEFGNRTGVKWDLSIDMGERSLDRDMSTTIFRIFQETLTNIIRHAGATVVSVSLNENGRCLILQVKDNGKGITEEELTDPRSYGLMGMRERVQSWEGSIMISGMENKGTTVTVSIPLDNKGQEK